MELVDSDAPVVLKKPKELPERTQKKKADGEKKDSRIQTRTGPGQLLSVVHSACV